MPRNNAVYCSQGDFIAYDVAWSVAAFRQVGDAFVFYLLGHEYAHGIQVRLGINYSFTIQQELQADCMAGAYLGDSVVPAQLTLAEGDLDEFREGVAAVGDDPDQPWFAEGSHGTAEQRTDYVLPRLRARPGGLRPGLMPPATRADQKCRARPDGGRPVTSAPSGRRGRAGPGQIAPISDPPWRIR